ncbi:MAG TPA: hypothetical protein VN851_17980 [Thermoanaerobaculia bacterium]|nr:hypothetical protein [Thermoanaerobaculia bacterium]
MPNTPEEREEFPADGSDEDRNREGQREDVPEREPEEEQEDRYEDRRDDREREGLQVRARLDPTRYVL